MKAPEESWCCASSRPAVRSAHTHPDANEWAYVLSGEWEESGVTYTTGALFYAPKGVRHGPHVAKTEVISLTIFDGPLTVV